MGLLAGIALFAFIFLYRNQVEAKRIQALTDYLGQVPTGKAAILSATGEDDFSKLEDAIYKTVAFLYQTKAAAVQAKNNFAENLSNIAHQIKTPITAISLSVQTMQSEQEEPSSGISIMIAVFFGGFCVLLAVIGIGNVFPNTLRFVRQRKREFARYMSVGMAPAEIRKMFCIEALVIAGRPVFITLPIAGLTVWYILQTSYIEAVLFLAEMPLIPIAIFMLAIVGTVTFAYYLGWRNVRKINLTEVLRDDTML